MADSSEPLAEIPRAVFVEDVKELLKDRTSAAVLQELGDRHQQYRLVEGQLLQRRARLKSKLPELQKALDIVKLLLSKKDQEDALLLDFALSDQVYAKAKIQNVQTVNLWLGAGVMVEYTLEDALNLLEENLELCKANLKTNQESLELIKDNVTITEVSIARVYNYDVEQKRLQKGS